MSAPRSRSIAGNFLICCILVAGTALITRQALSQDGAAKKSDAKMQGGGKEMSAQDKKMMEMGSPGPNHKRLQFMVGHWEVKSSMRWTPDMPLSEGDGTAEVTSIMDGRYFVEKYEGNSGGMPFSGMGVTGYDNMKKKYFNTWIDSMGTSVMISWGTADASGKTITYAAEYDDPMSGKAKKVKSVFRILGDDKRSFTMFDTDKDGKEFKSLEVNYTRK